MTTVVYHQPASSFTLQDWSKLPGTVIGATYREKDAQHETLISGNFTHNGNTITGGQIYEASWTYDNTPLLSIYYTKFDAVNAANATPAELAQLMQQGNDSVQGTAFNDRFYSTPGNNTYNGDVNGSKSLDTLVYAGSKSSLSVTPTTNAGGNLSLYQVRIDGKVDTLNGVERIEMGDGSVLALDVNAGENAGSAYRLYQAAFDRKADTAGLNYWTKELDGGKSLLNVANGFVNSDEFKVLNPGSDQNALINGFYQHVLHRDADAPGLEYWNAQMSNGMSASGVLVSFSESQENIANVAAQLNAGVWLV